MRGRVVARIALVGVDDQVYVAVPGQDTGLPLTHRPPSQDGLQMSTMEFFWPTWSPTGQALAVSVLTRTGPEADPSAALAVLDPGTGAMRQLYQNPPVRQPLVAPGTPHYACWSPDGSRLAFLTAEPSGLALQVSTLESGEEPKRVLQGAPCFFAWSPDSRSLLVHVGETLVLLEGLSLQEAWRREVGTMGFRTPAWSPDGKRILYAMPGAGPQNLLWTISSTGEAPQPIAPLGPRAGFLWSPRGDLIALMESADASGPAFSHLALARHDGRGVLTLAEETVLACFWAPNGRRLAYVALEAGASDRLAWKVVDVAEAVPRKLAEFLPHEAFFVLLSFWDQYGYSHAVWSPGSSHLLFAGGLPGQQPAEREGASGEGPMVYLLDVEGDPTPRPVARGSMPAWAWR